MALLDEAELQDFGRANPEWTVSGGSIEREWKLADFAAAVEFVDRVAEVAERLNHHPDILLHGYNRVRLTLSTHSAGGVTEHDVGLAAEIDAL